MVFRIINTENTIALNPNIYLHNPSHVPCTTLQVIDCLLVLRRDRHAEGIQRTLPWLMVIGQLPHPIHRLNARG